MTDEQLLALIETHIPKGSVVHKFYLPHVRSVATKAVEIARRLKLTNEQIRFIEEGAMLHDIGIVGVHAPDIGCHGDRPYLQHGLAGAEILRAAGLPKHAELVERHLGVGISAKEIQDQQLPLPDRDFLPRTIEEEIVTYADLFFSKTPRYLTTPRTLEEVRAQVEKWGGENLERLESMIQRFE